MALFYNICKNCSEIRLTKIMDLNNQKMENYPPSPIISRNSNSFHFSVYDTISTGWIYFQLRTNIWVNSLFVDCCVLIILVDKYLTLLMISSGYTLIPWVAAQVVRWSGIPCSGREFESRLALQVLRFVGSVNTVQYVKLKGYYPCWWGVRPVNWIYRLWRHCPELVVVDCN